MKKIFQRLWIGSLLLLFGCVFSVSAADKESATARRLAREGYVNIQKEDPSIHVSLMYSRADNFCGVVLYDDLKEAFLHPEAMAALKKAQAYLKQLRPDLSLKVYDAARPMRIQQKMWDKVKHTNKDIYVSNPAHGGGMHNYGMAVDHEDRLVSEKKISPKARENRQLLRKVMRHGGFIPLRTEWWHFNKCSRATAKKYYKVIP